LVSLALIGIVITLFLAFGGISLTKTAVAETRILVADVKKELGNKDKNTSTGSPQDRDIEDQ